MSFASPACVSFSLLGVRDRQESEGTLAFKYVFGRGFKRGGWKNFQQTSGLENPFVSLDTVLPADILTWKKEWAGMRRMHITHVCLRHAIRPRWRSWWMISLSAVFHIQLGTRAWLDGGLVELLKVTEWADCPRQLTQPSAGTAKCILFFPRRLDSLKFLLLNVKMYLNFTYQTAARSKTDSSTCFWSYGYRICVSCDFTVSNMTYEETKWKIRWRKKKKQH